MVKEGQKVDPEYRKYGIHCPGGLTQQHFKDECDINLIMERSLMGQMPILQERQPMYADVSNIPDYQEALGVVMLAEMAFDSLDAKTRKRFDNDPAVMMEFIADNKNYDEAVKLGLVNGPPKVEPEKIQKVIVVPQEEPKK